MTEAAQQQSICKAGTELWTGSQHCNSKTTKSNTGANRGGDLAQQLKALVALTENPGSVLRTHMVAYKH